MYWQNTTFLFPQSNIFSFILHTSLIISLHLTVRQQMIKSHETLCDISTLIITTKRRRFLVIHTICKSVCKDFIDTFTPSGVSSSKSVLVPRSISNYALLPTAKPNRRWRSMQKLSVASFQEISRLRTITIFAERGISLTFVGICARCVHGAA